VEFFYEQETAEKEGGGVVGEELERCISRVLRIIGHVRIIMNN
jgi:hypothetical protein